MSFLTSFPVSLTRDALHLLFWTRDPPEISLPELLTCVTGSSSLPSLSFEKFLVEASFLNALAPVDLGSHLDAMLDEAEDDEDDDDDDIDDKVDVLDFVTVLPKTGLFLPEFVAKVALGLEDEEDDSGWKGLAVVRAMDDFVDADKPDDDDKDEDCDTEEEDDEEDEVWTVPEPVFLSAAACREELRPDRLTPDDASFDPDDELTTTEDEDEVDLLSPTEAAASVPLAWCLGLVAPPLPLVLESPPDFLLWSNLAFRSWTLAGWSGVWMEVRAMRGAAPVELPEPFAADTPELVLGFLEAMSLIIKSETLLV